MAGELLRDLQATASLETNELFFLKATVWQQEIKELLKDSLPDKELKERLAEVAAWTVEFNAGIYAEFKKLDKKLDTLIELALPHLPQFDSRKKPLEGELGPLWLKTEYQVNRFCERPEMGDLRDFIKKDKRFLCWAATGEAGAGKTRLAREMLMEAERDWFCLYLRADDIRRFCSHDNRRRWRPPFRPLFVVDYVGEIQDSSTISDFIETMKAISDEQGLEVRILFVERAWKKQPWWETLISTDIKHLLYDEAPAARDPAPEDRMLMDDPHRPLELQPFGEGIYCELLRSFLTGLAEASEKSLPSIEDTEETKATLAKHTKGEPLYFGLVALAMVESGAAEVLDYGRGDLLLETWKTERRKWERREPLAELRDDAEKLLIFAAMGFPLNSGEGLLVLEKDERLRWNGNRLDNALKCAERITGSPACSLGPDLVTEYFVVQLMKEKAETFGSVRDTIIEHCRRANLAGCAPFLLRAYRDYHKIDEEVNTCVKTLLAQWQAELDANGQLHSETSIHVSVLSLLSFALRDEEVCAIAFALLERFIKEYKIDSPYSLGVANDLLHITYIAHISGRLEILPETLSLLRDLAARHEGEREIQVILARSLGNAIAAYGEKQESLRMAEVLVELRDFAALHEGVIEIQVALAGGLGNVIAGYGKKSELPRMAEALQELRELAARNEGEREIQVALAKGLYNAATVYGKKSELPRMAEVLRELRDLATLHQGEPEIQVVLAKGLVNAIVGYGKKLELPRMAEALQELRDLAARHEGEREIQVALAVGLGNVVYYYGKNSELPRMAEVLDELRELAARYEGEREIQVTLAGGLTSAARGFGKNAKLTQMAEFLQELRDLAARHGGISEIQVTLAKGLIGSTLSRLKHEGRAPGNDLFEARDICNKHNVEELGLKEAFARFYKFIETGELLEQGDWLVVNKDYQAGE